MDFPERIFFVTTVTAGRKPLFCYERSARLFLDTLFGHRERGIFLLHEFVVMPDHVHLILAPTPTLLLERSVQFIKGGYSHRYMKETGSRAEIWERSFTNHGIRDWDDYEKHRRYVHLNPVRAGLVEAAQDYSYCSAHLGFLLDASPQRLKPVA
ncbi:MAG TPA: transposase [Terriglobales bacterium]|jgi:putative transposase|nr:transposase [Terriglobales bacterium]